MLHTKVPCLLVMVLALSIVLYGPESGWSYKKSSKEHGIAQNQRVKVKTLIDEADALARESSTKQQLDQAISMLKGALEIADSRDMPAASARACAALGVIYLRSSDYTKALEYSQRAVVDGKRGGNCKAQASGEKNIGIVHMARGEYSPAEQAFSEAIRTAESCGGKIIIGWTLWGWGRVHRFQDRYSKALTVLQKGLDVNSEIGNQELEGYLRKEIGGVCASVGQYSKAANYLGNALSLGEAIDNPRLQQEALAEMGNVYLNWGKYREAANCFQKTMNLARRRGEKRMEAQALLSLGNVYEEWGRYTDALICFQKALSMSKATGIARQKSRVLMEMGKVFSLRGQYDKAIEFYDQAMAQFQRIGNTRGEADVLRNLGLVYETLGQYDNALEKYQRALDIYQRIGTPTRLAKSSIGNLYLDIGEVEKAERFISDSGHLPSLGRLCLVKADYHSARKHYETLLKTAEQNRNANELFTACTGLGMAYEGMDDMHKAEEYFRKAVEHTEDLRSNLSPNERETFFDVRIYGFFRTAPYEGLARVLVKMDRPVEAFKESEYTRARVFSEALTKTIESPSLDVPKEIRETDSMLTDQLAALTQNLQKASEGGNKDLIASLGPQVLEAKEKLTTFVNMLRVEHPLFAATMYPQPMDLEKTALKENEWVLAYHVSNPGLIIYVTHGKKLIRGLFKTIPREQVDNLVGKFREPLEIKAGDNIIGKLKIFDFSTGKKLSDILLSDVLSAIPKDSHIIVIPDDILGVLPFEMLPLNTGGKISTDRKIPYASGADFFGDRNPISYYQSATALTLSRNYGKQKGATSKLLVFADPVFGATDARYQEGQKTTQVAEEETTPYKDIMAFMADNSGSGGGIPRLALTSELADDLVEMYGANTESYTGLQANKDKFLERTGLGQTDYDKIVFATHGYFGKDLPAIKEPVLILSLVPPGTDGFLRMSEVMSLKMNTDVVALTACQTGLGKKISGEGTMGMGRAFQYSGAKCVLMSLWSVQQSASVNLVKSLFRNIKEGKTKLNALQLSRQELRDQGYDHPFFWASFILVGEVN